MKTPTLLFLILCFAGCSTWAPAKTVTLHDVDQDLAAIEGSDLRYRTAPPVVCDGPRGCRDVTTDGASLATYKWESLCDGRFCDSTELEYVALTREAAMIAFTAEQVSAASVLLARPETSGDDRLRLATFVETQLQMLEQRIPATDSALRALVVDEAFVGSGIQQDARRYLVRATSYLSRARALIYPQMGTATATREASNEH